MTSPKAAIAAPSPARRGFPSTRSDGTTTPIPKTTSETPRANRHPLLIDGPAYVLPDGNTSWACGAEEPAPAVRLVIPTGARIAEKMRSTTDSSWSLASGLGMQLHVAEANMLGLMFAVPVIPTIPNAPKSTANAR